MAQADKETSDTKTIVLADDHPIVRSRHYVVQQSPVPVLVVHAERSEK